MSCRSEVATLILKIFLGVGREIRSIVKLSAWFYLDLLALGSAAIVQTLIYTLIYWLF